MLQAASLQVSHLDPAAAGRNNADSGLGKSGIHDLNELALLYILLTQKQRSFRKQLHDGLMDLQIFLGPVRTAFRRQPLRLIFKLFLHFKRQEQVLDRLRVITHPGARSLEQLQERSQLFHDHAPGLLQAASRLFIRIVRE